MIIIFQVNDNTKSFYNQLKSSHITGFNDYIFNLM
jgi:hypothetical protein